MQRPVPTASVVLFTGNYGSGKTEVAVNYTAHFARLGNAVKIADLDLVNPYFRCREARDVLTALGVEVIAPDGEFHNADLPIVLPRVRGSIEKENGLTVLDVGGDSVGATVVSSLVTSFARGNYEMFFVLNKNRPFTGTIEGALRLIREVEEGARLPVTAIVSNTHLIDETTPQMVADGITFAQEVAAAKGVPFAFVAAMRSLFDDPVLANLDVPALAMERMLLPPWKQRITGRQVTHARDGWGRISS